MSHTVQVCSSICMKTLSQSHSLQQQPAWLHTTPFPLLTELSKPLRMSFTHHLVDVLLNKQVIVTFSYLSNFLVVCPSTGSHLKHRLTGSLGWQFCPYLKWNMFGRKIELWYTVHTYLLDKSMYQNCDIQNSTSKCWCMLLSFSLSLVHSTGYK